MPVDKHLLEALYQTDKDRWREKDAWTKMDRETGGTYLYEPASVGGSWGVAELRKTCHTYTGLHQPAPGTFQTLHL